MATPTKPFRITYTDDTDPGCPDFTTTVRAYDIEHAQELLCEDIGWCVISIKRVPS